MATTTNYGFEIPDDTDLVKDGALAMRDLGQDVDTQLFTALGGNYPGLRLVKKQTIGTGVSSVNVTGAFSATYENYKIILSGGVASTANNILFTLGATTTGYYEARINCTYATGVISANTTNNGSSGTIGQQTTQGLFANLDIISPFLTAQTNWGSTQLAATTTRVDQTQGMLNNTTSYTAFTITAGAGTLTGGTIYVYGYGVS
jgi:hypothetical protein